MSTCNARKRKCTEWKNSSKEGSEDSLRWLASCTLDDLYWMAIGKMNVPSWEPCPIQDLNKGEKVRYNREKKCYELCFRSAVCSFFMPRIGNVEFAFHFQGLKDGMQWARDIATAGELQRLKQRFADFAPIYFYSELLSLKSIDIEAATSPAQLVVNMLHTGPDEDLAELELDSLEFRKFWMPFVSEPIEQVMANLTAVTNTRGHKLRVPQYVEGFIDGALGLTRNALGDVLLPS